MIIELTHRLSDKYYQTHIGHNCAWCRKWFICFDDDCNEPDAAKFCSNKCHEAFVSYCEDGK